MVPLKNILRLYSYKPYRNLSVSREGHDIYDLQKGDIIKLNLSDNPFTMKEVQYHGKKWGDMYFYALTFAVEPLYGALLEFSDNLENIVVRKNSGFGSVPGYRVPANPERGSFVSEYHIFLNPSTRNVNLFGEERSKKYDDIIHILKPEVIYDK